MSHHLDSPASRLNLTDMCVFDGATGTTFAMIVNSSLAGDQRVPGFHPEGRYQFKVHFDGEERESLTYRVTFGDTGDDGEQPLTSAAARFTGATNPDAYAELVTHRLLPDPVAVLAIVGLAFLLLLAGLESTSTGSAAGCCG